MWWTVLGILIPVPSRGRVLSLLEVGRVVFLDGMNFDPNKTGASGMGYQTVKAFVKAGLVHHDPNVSK